MSLPRLALRDEAAPAPRPGEALVRIEAAGICGSDLHSYLGQDAHRPTGGVIVHVGLQDLDGGGLDLRKMTLQEVAVLGSYTYTKDDFAGTLAAMAEGRFGALDWFESRSLSEGAAAFAELVAGTAAAAKIVLRPEWAARGRVTAQLPGAGSGRDENHGLLVAHCRSFGPRDYRV